MPKKWFTLTMTNREDGVVEEFGPCHPEYDDLHERLRHILGVSAGELIGRLMKTCNSNAPAVATTEFLYRYEPSREYFDQDTED